MTEFYYTIIGKLIERGDVVLTWFYSTFGGCF